MPGCLQKLRLSIWENWEVLKKEKKKCRNPCFVTETDYSALFLDIVFFHILIIFKTDPYRCFSLFKTNDGDQVSSLSVDNAHIKSNFWIF